MTDNLQLNLDRQAELREAVSKNRTQNIPPYAGVHIQSRAELLWIIHTARSTDISLDSGESDSERIGQGSNTKVGVVDLRQADLSNLDLAGIHLQHVSLADATLTGANLQGADLRGADLSGADLSGGRAAVFELRPAEFLPALQDEDVLKVKFTGANVSDANLRGARLDGAKLQGGILIRADMSATRMWQSDLREAALWGANLRDASLLGADLGNAYLNDADLTGAYLRNAQLTGADLRGAILSHADFRGVTLCGADLRAARMNAETNLTGIEIDNESLLADVVWNGAPITQVQWGRMRMLGDERRALVKRANDRSNKPRGRRMVEFRAAVRANRQVAAVLAEQGLNEDADRFAYRARRLQRAVILRQGVVSWPTAFGSLCLDLVAGYGYKPWRAFVSYLLIVSLFALGYYLVGLQNPHPLSWGGSFVFSITSFHGRGFFPGGIDLDNPITKLAALEAFIGLLLEASFIATFIQRFFGLR